MEFTLRELGVIKEGLRGLNKRETTLEESAFIINLFNKVTSFEAPIAEIKESKVCDKEAEEKGLLK